MSSVIIACSLFAPHRLVAGTAIILHLINPIAIFVYYFVFCDGRGHRLPCVLATLILPTAYYIFMVMYGITGTRTVYPQFNPNSISVLNLTLVGVAALIGLFVIGVVLLKLNTFVHNFAEKRKLHKEQNVNL